MAVKPYILLCTVGTSLEGNLKRGFRDGKDIDDYTKEDWRAAAQHILSLEPNDRQCGAEINSVQALLDEDLIEKNEIHFLHSDTRKGSKIAELLKQVFEQRGFHGHVHLCKIDGLQDSDPNTFRSRGLRNLVRILCDGIKQYGSGATAINATGGYKAQIAIAVMIGQALGVQVFYKHERFAERSIISFPPLPIALDEKVWLDNFSLFKELYEEDFVPFSRYSEEWDEVLESLIERDRQEGEEFLSLSSAGQILHEKLKDRNGKEVEPLRKAKSKEKEPPRLGEGHLSAAQPKIRAFMQRVIDSNSFVKTCLSIYANPDRPDKIHFRLSRGNVTGIFSDGTVCAKFVVKTTADSGEQKLLAVEKLNQWWRENS